MKKLITLLFFAVISLIGYSQGQKNALEQPFTITMENDTINIVREDKIAKVSIKSDSDNSSNAQIKSLYTTLSLDGFSNDSIILKPDGVLNLGANIGLIDSTRIIAPSGCKLYLYITRLK